MHLLLVIGTRPEAIKCFPVVEALRQRAGLEVSICVSAQHRQILDQVLDLVGLEPDYDLEVMRSAPTLTDTTCDVLQRLGDVLDKAQPHRVLVQGDTTTTFAAALAAFYRKIPVAHIEAGLRTHNILSPWPEEANRRIVSSLADLHFAPTPGARANLLAENVSSDRIFVTGNTVIDALRAIVRRLDARKSVSPLIEPVVSKLQSGGRRLILITTHRRENWGNGLRGICQAAIGLAARGDVHIAIPVHPNPNVRKLIHEELAGRSAISLLAPLDYVSFVDLMRRSHIVLTDSGGVQEEAPALNKPVLILRDTTERPEGVAAGASKLVGLHPAQIIAAAEGLLDDEAEYTKMSHAPNPFGDGLAAERIAQILEDAAGKSRPLSSTFYMTAAMETSRSAEPGD
jgi:UDP-N-acetylglucosamine 2-epimerase (non-hydrolysing)